MTTLNLPLGWQRAEVRRFARVRTGKTVASVPSSRTTWRLPTSRRLTFSHWGDWST